MFCLHQLSSLLLIIYKGLELQLYKVATSLQQENDLHEKLTSELAISNTRRSRQSASRKTSICNI